MSVDRKEDFRNMADDLAQDIEAELLVHVQEQLDELRSKQEAAAPDEPIRDEWWYLLD